MGAFRNVVVGILAISLLTFVALFGQLPALRKTPIGRLQRALCLHLPNALRHLDRRMTGGRLTERGKKFGHYLFYEQNPIVLVIFIFLLTGSSIMFLCNALHRLPKSLILPIPMLLAFPYGFVYLSVVCKSHFITPANHQARIRDYPFDHILFRRGKICGTCGLVKPARSKHCSLCGCCVAKCDHHCPWINNCVGRGNYGYFLGLLLSLGILQLYGAYLSWHILSPFIHVGRTESLFTRVFWHRIGFSFLIAANEGGLSIAGVGLFAAVTAPLPLTLLAYHLYLVWAGMTTNESQKWADWRDDIADGVVFKANYHTLRMHNQQGDSGNHAIGGSVENPALDGGSDENVYAEPWPKESKIVLVRTNDGRPPAGQELIWSRVFSLKDIDNVYDLGAWQNLVDVLQRR